MKRLWSINPWVALMLGSVTSTSALCSGGSTPVEICDNGRDDDGDGFADCTDTECSGGNSILINEIQYQPTFVADVDGEYVELLNAGDLCADISGWSISEDSGFAPTVFPAGSVMAPGTTFVIAGAFYPEDNCGVYARATWKFESTLNDTCDTLTLKDKAGTQIAKVTYCNGTNGWAACPAGAGLEYCGEWSSTANATASNWRCATTTYGCGDKGTPAEDNACPAP